MTILCCFCGQPMDLNATPPGGVGYFNNRQGDAYHAGRGQCLEALRRAGWKEPT